MCRHKLAVRLRYGIENASVSAEVLDDEHLGVMSRRRLRVRWQTIHTFLDGLSREEIIDLAMRCGFESSRIGWPLSAAAASWSMGPLGFADHLYAGVDEALSAEAATEAVPVVPEEHCTVMLVLHVVIDQGGQVQLLPAVTVLVLRMRQVVDASMPVSTEVRRFYARCMDLLEQVTSRGAGRERAEPLFDELMGFTDIHIDMGAALARRWSRLLRIDAEAAFARDDLDGLARVLSRWGGAPYGEYMRRVTNERSKGEILPVTEAAARAGRITQLHWIDQLSRSEIELPREQISSGMRFGVPVDSRRSSPLRHG